MSDILKWDKKLKRISAIVNGTETAIYVDDSNRGKPIAVFIHGIGGSHYGLAKMARTMSEYQSILIDLPGHGDSSIPDWCDIDSLRDWLVELWQLLEMKYGKPNTVIAHSFGCYIVDPEQIQSKVVFVCPVPRTSPFYEMYAKVGQKLFDLPSFTRVYNSQRFARLRGEILLRKKSTSVRQYVAEISSTEKATTTDQRKYQAKLSGIKLDDVFKDIRPSVVVAGSRDDLAVDNTDSNLRLIFPRSDIKMIDGGHLLPIEDPDSVADYIASWLNDSKVSGQVVIK